MSYEKIKRSSSHCRDASNKKKMPSACKIIKHTRPFAMLTKHRRIVSSTSCLTRCLATSWELGSRGAGAGEGEGDRDNETLQLEERNKKILLRPLTCSKFRMPVMVSNSNVWPLSTVTLSPSCGGRPSSQLELLDHGPQNRRRACL